MTLQEAKARIEQAKPAVKSEKTLLDNNEGPFELLNRRQRRERRSRLRRQLKCKLKLKAPAAWVWT
jgi:hypothetical protein